MKKLLCTIMLVYTGCVSIYAQTGSNLINNVPIPFEQKLATLFSQLNFTDVKTGLLEERGFCPLNPGYFKGENIPYQKLSAQDLTSWQQNCRLNFNRSIQVSSSIAELQSALKRLDSSLQKYFVPALSAANPAPVDMQIMLQQTSSYKKLDSTLASLSAKNQSVSTFVNFYLSDVSTLLKPYINSYSPQSLHSMLTDDNAANKLALRMLYEGMYNAAVDPLRRPLEPLTTYDTRLQAAPAGVVSISMLHLNYYTLSPTALTDKLLTYSAGNFRDVAGRSKSPYVRTNIVAASTLSDTVSPAFEYMIRPELFVTNTGKTLQWVDIDFGNGQGYQRVMMNTPRSVSYAKGGDVQIKYILRYTDGSVAVCQSGAFVKQRTCIRTIRL